MEKISDEGQFAGLYDIAFNPILKRVHYTVSHFAEKYGCHSIIDLGSGTGAQCRVLAADGFLVTGIDASIQMIAVAKKKTEDSVTFIHDDIRKTTINEKTFDAANISLVLHPNAKKTIFEILQKSKTLVKPNGVVFITDYGIGTKFSGRLSNGLIRIVESFTRPDHRNHYFEFMGNKGIDMLNSFFDVKILEKQHYFNGALQTYVITFSK